MVATTTTVIVEDVFNYRGLGRGGFGLEESLYANFGERFAEIAGKAGTLSKKTGLYILGRDLQRGVEDAESQPEGAKMAAKAVYADAQQRRQGKNYAGTCHSNAIEILGSSATIKGNAKPPGEYVAAIFYENTGGFEKNRSGGYEVIEIPGKTTKHNIWLPEGGGSFIIYRIQADAYNWLGLPDETTPDIGVAIKSFMKAGFTEQEAKNEISRLYWGGKGLRAVLSNSNVLSGPLCVNFDSEPWFRIPNIGSFAVSSIAERSEAETKSGVIVPPNEYTALLKHKETLEAIKQKVNE